MPPSKDERELIIELARSHDDIELPASTVVGNWVLSTLIDSSLQRFALEQLIKKRFR